MPAYAGLPTHVPKFTLTWNISPCLLWTANSNQSQKEATLDWKVPELCPWFPGEKTFFWELPGFEKTFFSSLAWCDSSATDSAHNVCGSMTGKRLSLRCRDLPGRSLEMSFHPSVLHATETFAEDVLWQTIGGQDRNYTIFYAAF